MTNYKDSSNHRLRLLLHVCCAVCALYPVSLLSKDFKITLFFYNPNIHPREEYNKRLESVKIISKKYSIPLVIDRYELKKWLRLTENYKLEPEDGKRCSICFDMRLKRTATVAKKLKFDLFGTTLTVSPHKDKNIINSIGKDLATDKKTKFYSADFKKNDGFKKTMDTAKKINIYRQNYCGCIYSLYN